MGLNISQVSDFVEPSSPNPDMSGSVVIFSRSESTRTLKTDLQVVLAIGSSLGSTTGGIQVVALSAQCHRAHSRFKWRRGMECNSIPYRVHTSGTDDKRQLKIIPTMHTKLNEIYKHHDTGLYFGGPRRRSISKKAVNVGESLFDFQMATLGSAVQYGVLSMCRYLQIGSASS